MKPVLFIDIDRTVFATDNFIEFVITILTELSGKNREELAPHLYLLSVGNDYHLRHTDFEGLLQAVAVDKADFLALLQQRAVPGQFIVEDAAAFLAWATTQQEYEARLLSFGQHDFQQAKIAVSPQLQALPADIIMTRKNAFIARYYQGRTGYLVDDKPDQQLPAGWEEIYIDRKASTMVRPAMIASGVLRITTLSDVPQSLHSAHI